MVWGGLPQSEEFYTMRKATKKALRYKEINGCEPTASTIFTSRFKQDFPNETKNKRVSVTLEPFCPNPKNQHYSILCNRFF
jgi:hypothetical protein